MVSFHNIQVNRGVITAIAINESNNNTEKISARMDGTYHSSSDTDIVKATWNLVIEYEKTRKLPGSTTICWG